METPNLIHTLYFLAAENTTELLLERKPEEESPSLSASSRDLGREWSEQPSRRVAGSRR